MKQLKRFLEMTEGTYGSRGSYDDAVAPDHNWAYLCGHYKLLLGEAIKLLGGRKDALRFASAHIEKCARCEEGRESSIPSTHSDTSRRQVVEAMQAIENTEANVGDHDNH